LFSDISQCLQRIHAPCVRRARCGKEDYGVKANPTILQNLLFQFGRGKVSGTRRDYTDFIRFKTRAKESFSNGMMCLVRNINAPPGQLQPQVVQHPPNTLDTLDDQQLRHADPNFSPTKKGGHPNPPLFQEAPDQKKHFSLELKPQASAPLSFPKKLAVHGPYCKILAQWIEFANRNVVCAFTIRYQHFRFFHWWL